MLKAIGKVLQKLYSSKRKNQNFLVSDRVQMCCDGVIDRLKSVLKKMDSKVKKTIGDDRRYVGIAPVKRPPVKRPRSPKSSKSKESDKRRKVTPLPPSEEARKESDLIDIISDDDEDESENPSLPALPALPEIKASYRRINSHEMSSAKKKKKKKKSVRFDLSRNTTHFVPFKERSTRLQQSPKDKHKMSRAEALLLARKQGKKGKIQVAVIHGLLAEGAWIQPPPIAGVDVLGSTDKDDIKDMEDRRKEMRKKIKSSDQVFLISPKDTPPENPESQNERARRRIKQLTTKTVEIDDVTARRTQASTHAHRSSAAYQQMSSVFGMQNRTSPATTSQGMGAYKSMNSTGAQPVVGQGRQGGGMPSAMTICKYFNSPGGCMRGEKCHFLHTRM